MLHRSGILGLALAVLALCACATPVGGPPLPPPPVHANGQALWRIISTQCLPGEIEHHNPAPCALVDLTGGAAHGFVVLKDRGGVAQHLLMPTDKITGIEDPKILEPGAANGFARAWEARRFVEARLGRALPREDVSVAVNSIYGRSQDQLHLHVDCIYAGVRDALKAEAPVIGLRWSAPIAIAGHAYRIRRIDGADLGATNPFRLLADTLPGAAAAMGGWTLVLAGETAPDGRPGFYLLAERADPARGEDASGERLQDHACKGRAAPPTP